MFEVGHAGAGSASASTTLGLAYPAGMAAGDIAILSLALGALSAITEPTGYTPVDNLDEGTGLRTKTWVRICDGAESGTLNVNWTGSTTGAAGLVVYRGYDATAPVGTHAVSGNTTSATIRSGPAWSAALFRTARDIAIFTDVNTTGVESWSTVAGFNKVLDVTSAVTPFVGLTLQDAFNTFGAASAAKTATSTLTGTAFVGYHLGIQGALATTGAELDTTGYVLDAAAIPANPSMAALFTPIGTPGPDAWPAAGQGWPRRRMVAGTPAAASVSYASQTKLEVD